MHAIEAKGISKRFRIVKDPVRTLKDRFVHLRGQRYRDLWAVKELDLTVELVREVRDDSMAQGIG